MENQIIEKPKIQWRNGILWLLVLAPLFFVLYGWANTYSASLPKNSVGEIVYDWERYTPFWSWTILPYWSIDLLYGLSLFLPMTKFMQRQHALRLLVATPIAVLFFWLFPLTFSITRPESYGIWKTLFDALLGFDKPYNQAPSLHIILLVILWQIYLPHFSKTGKWLWNFWCFWIGISVLTTFQHHFIDIPAGFLVGICICYIFPFSEKQQWQFQKTKLSFLAKMYLFFGLCLLLVSFSAPIAVALVSIWLGISLLVIGFGYWGLGVTIFQKNEDGKFSFASKVLHYPYRMLTKFIRHYFFKTYHLPQKITEKLYLGSFNMSKTTHCQVIFDLCSEYPRINFEATNYESFPLMDLVVPTREELKFGVKKLDCLIQNNTTVFVHCALGLSRSATVVFAWLLFSKKYATISAIFTFFESQNYQVHLSKKHIALLENYHQNL
jgi:Dual specificity phosphatase, catalytic domain